MKKITAYITSSPFAAIAAHVLILLTMYCILSFLGFIKGMPTNESLIQYDVVFYKSIADAGYSYAPGTQSNVAFFPLFPLIWKLSHLSSVMMSLLNLVFMLAGMVILNKVLRLRRSEFLLLLSTPSLLFCYIPYSEALFFLSCSLFIYGLDRNFKLALLGIFLACLCRSASMTFIPVLIFTALFYIKPKRTVENRKHIIRFSLLIAASLLALLLSQFIQYLQTGEFFVIFEAQKQWDRVFKFPTSYLTTWDGIRLIWLDGLAFLTGVVSAVIAVIVFIRKVSGTGKTISPVFVFSIGYLALVTVTILFFSTVDTYLGGTSIFSLNRFVFATPFFFVFLMLSFRYFKLNVKLILYFTLISAVVWLLFNAHGYIEGLTIFDLKYFKTKLYFIITFLYSLVYVAMIDKNKRLQLWSGLYIFNIILQLYLFNGFFNGRWVG